MDNNDNGFSGSDPGHVPDENEVVGVRSFSFSGEIEESPGTF